MQEFERLVPLAALVLMAFPGSATFANEDENPEESGAAFEFELKLEGEQRRQSHLGEVSDDREKNGLAELSASVFYPVTPQLALFGEVIAIFEGQTTDGERDWQSDESLERGESWLRWQPDADLNLTLKLGRQEFTEPRQWWWDEDLDALRVDYQTNRWSLAAALARETAPISTLDSQIHPSEDDVVRALGAVHWYWTSDQQLEAFALYQNDRSSTPNVGDKVTQDDSVDANLDWLGLRASGDLRLGGYGSLIYWLDSAWVWGDERVVEFEEGEGAFLVSDRTRRDVRGWALDVGGLWTLPVAGQPTLRLGYAYGSGDADPDSGLDRSFRQTGLQENEDRIHYYGELFDPELSNLQVFTVGISGLPSENTWLALMHHRYRQAVAADYLRETGIDLEPDGIATNLGWGWDLVFQQTWENGLSLEVIGSMFQAGRAFGEAEGERAYRGYVELIYEF